MPTTTRNRTENGSSSPFQHQHHRVRAHRQARARVHQHANAHADTHTHEHTWIHAYTQTHAHTHAQRARGMRLLSRSPPLAPSARCEDFWPRECKVVWPGVSRAWRPESRSSRRPGEGTGRRAEQCLPALGAAPAPVAHPPSSPTDAPILALRGNDILKAWSRPAPFSIARGWEAGRPEAGGGNYAGGWTPGPLRQGHERGGRRLNERRGSP